MSSLSGINQDPKYLKALEELGPVYTHQLEFPILGLDGTPISEISFREPTAGDIYMVGNPVTRVDYMVDPWRIERDQAVYFDMLQKLSGVPQVQLLKLAPTDLVTIEAMLDRFFCPGVRTRPSKPTKEKSSPPDEPAAS